MPGANNISWSALETSGLPSQTCAVVNLAGQQFMDFTKMWTPGYVTWNYNLVDSSWGFFVQVRYIKKNICVYVTLFNFSFKQNVKTSRVYTTKAIASAINKSQDKPRVFVLITGVGAYEPSETIKYDESSPTTGNDFFSKLLVEWEQAATVDPPVRLVRGFIEI